MDCQGRLLIGTMFHPRIREAAVVPSPDDKWSERPLTMIVPVDQPDKVSETE